MMFLLVFSFKLTSNHFRNSSLGSLNNNKEYNASLYNNKIKTKLPLQIPTTRLDIKTKPQLQLSRKISLDNIFVIRNSARTPHNSKLFLNHNIENAPTHSQSLLSNIQLKNNTNINNIPNVFYQQQENFPPINTNKQNNIEQVIPNHIRQKGNQSQDSFSNINKQNNMSNNNNNNLHNINNKHSLKKIKVNDLGIQDRNKKNSLEQSRANKKDSNDSVKVNRNKIMLCGGSGDDTSDSFYNEVQELLINVNPKTSNTNDKENTQKIIEPNKNEINKWKHVKRPETSYGDLNIRNNNLNTVLMSAKYRNNKLFMEKSNCNK